MATSSYRDALERALPEALRNLVPTLAPPDLWERAPLSATVFALARSGLFDADVYLGANPDVRAAKIDPLLHFVKYGIFEGRAFPAPPRQAGVTGAERPAVSIVIPVYNNARYLRECFASVAAQTLKNIEFIVVDDGSTDAAAIARMEEFARSDSRVRLIRKTNGGYGQSMNMGLDAAKGEYFGIVESDDCVRPDMYASYYQLAREHNLDIARSDALVFYGDGDRRFYQDRMVASNNALYNKIIDPAQEKTIFETQNVIWNGIYNLAFLRKHKIRFNESPGASYQDNGFWFLTLCHARRIMLTHGAWYLLRRDNEQSSYYSTGKIWAMTREYEFIYDQLKARPELYAQFVHQWQSKKISNYIFTLQRVAPEYRPELLATWAQEFARSQARGELDADILGKKYQTARSIIAGKYGTDWIKTPDISIAMPVRNGAEFLEPCLDSLLAQQFKNFELLVIDDGSTDNTSAILHKYAARDRRIQVFWQENRGAGVARNAVLSRARGEFVVFLDADDICKPALLQAMLATMRKSGADFCVCKSESLSMANGATKPLRHGIREDNLPKKMVFAPREIKNNIFRTFVGWAWDKIYRRDFLLRHNLKFQEIASSNDLLFVFSALLCAQKIAICPQVLMTHRVDAPSSVSNTRERHPLNFISALRALHKFLQTGKTEADWQESFRGYCAHAWLWNVRHIYGAAAIEIYKAKNDFMREFGLGADARVCAVDADEYAQFLQM